MDGKSRGHDRLKVAASPVPGRALAPETVRSLLGVGVHLRLIEVYDITPPDQSLAIDNHGIHITPTAKIHQGLDRIGIEGGAEVVNDGRRTVLEGVQEDIGAQGGDRLRRWGAHLAFEGGGK